MIPHPIQIDHNHVDSSASCHGQGTPRHHRGLRGSCSRMLHQMVPLRLDSEVLILLLSTTYTFDHSHGGLATSQASWPDSLVSLSAAACPNKSYDVVHRSSQVQVLWLQYLSKNFHNTRISLAAGLLLGAAALRSLHGNKATRMAIAHQAPANILRLHKDRPNASPLGLAVV